MKKTQITIVLALAAILFNLPSVYGQKAADTTVSVVDHAKEDSLSAVVARLTKTRDSLNKVNKVLLHTASVLSTQTVMPSGYLESQARKEDSLRRTIAVLVARVMDLSKQALNPVDRNRADSLEFVVENMKAQLNATTSNLSTSTATLQKAQNQITQMGNEVNKLLDSLELIEEKQNELQEFTVRASRPKMPLPNTPIALTLPQTSYSYCEDTVCDEGLATFLATTSLLARGDAVNSPKLLSDLVRLADDIGRLDPRSTAAYYVGLKWQKELLKGTMTKTGRKMVSNVQDYLDARMDAILSDKKLWELYGNRTQVKHLFEAARNA